MTIKRYTMDYDCMIDPPCECSVEEARHGEYVRYEDYIEVEHRLHDIDAEWERRFREQADHWDMRTKLIRKQLDKMVEMFAKGQSLIPPTIIINKNKP